MPKNEFGEVEWGGNHTKSDWLEPMWWYSGEFTHTRGHSCVPSMVDDGEKNSDGSQKRQRGLVCEYRVPTLEEWKLIRGWAQKNGQPKLARLSGVHRSTVQKVCTKPIGGIGKTSDEVIKHLVKTVKGLDF